jgi:Tfp pilus assembly protein PilO
MSKSSFKKLILCFVLALAVVGVGWEMLKRDELRQQKQVGL